MTIYTTRNRRSSRVALKDACVAIANARNPTRELQRQGTTIAHLVERRELPLDYAVHALEAAASHAGLSERENEDGLRAAFRFARLGVIRTNRRRAAEEAA